MTRQQLYELVWKQPATTLAQTYGISDVGLAKVCRRHDIPRPSRGYWAQKEAGKSPATTPLPRPEYDCKINLREVADLPPGSAEKPSSTLKSQKNALPIVAVVSSLSDPHELVRRAHEKLKDARADEQGILRNKSAATLAIEVSNDSLTRALLIMDAVIKELERGGHTVKSGPTVTIQGVDLKFSLYEHLVTERHSSITQAARGRREASA
jgi:hypothetical protein